MDIVLWLLSILIGSTMAAGTIVPTIKLVDSEAFARPEDEKEFALVTAVAWAIVDLVGGLALVGHFGTTAAIVILGVSLGGIPLLVLAGAGVSVAGGAWLGLTDRLRDRLNEAVNSHNKARKLLAGGYYDEDVAFELLETLSAKTLSPANQQKLLSISQVILENQNRDRRTLIQ